MLAYRVENIVILEIRKSLELKTNHQQRNLISKKKKKKKKGKPIIDK